MAQQIDSDTTKHRQMKTIMAINALSNAVTDLTENFRTLNFGKGEDRKAKPVATVEEEVSMGGPTGRTGDDKPIQRDLGRETRPEAAITGGVASR